MRHVIKTRRGTDALLTANENPPQDSDQSTRRWRNFRRDKADLMTLLLNEQYHLCCYSEIRADLRGLGYHIEHVENKSQQPVRTFDYQNLAASALDSENGLHQFGINAFGGHSRGKQEAVDMAKFIHCHIPDCSRYFAYLSDGRIVPADGLNAQEMENAQYTIDLLNLNSGFLQTERRNYWEELEQIFDENIGNRQNLQLLLQINLVPSPDHKLHEFFSITRQFFQQEAEQVLHIHAPALI
ncbi:TPA: retron system putative HNH endonuclease [Salmonella enterica subsp. salamae serovar 21:z10:[z6]]|uniref:TIGR02646 family protein n=2 Tax=Salmonella enterica TaxID=28901 RepID=A0A737VYT0_SALER|nr:retron system putative HNH endonuclease [Salmonella enterica]ECC9705991.1 TIGR02646 family protein [Salmonella enterica subsp. salamae]ECG1420715.1 TIGR02646 family protein [Salmonella enterica subsp. salamae str. CFSAN000559]HCM2004739.1 TIGR02646 family protein [Salmonella enterica subsp. salamae serovar 21:z10:[z6]]EBO9194741.1 TIGR02646 family protein [Salmonella enterica]NMJ15329.1 TIGR02646 family protein [Salmonella enterica subsp. enterica serovar Anatum]